MNNTINTTIRCSSDEHKKFSLVAEKRGITVVNLVNKAVENHLPLKKIDFIDRAEIRDKTLGASLPQGLRRLINKDKKRLTSPFEAVRLYHVVLTALMMECGV